MRKYSGSQWADRRRDQCGPWSALLTVGAHQEISKCDMMDCNHAVLWGNETPYAALCLQVSEGLKRLSVFHLDTMYTNSRGLRGNGRSKNGRASQPMYGLWCGAYQVGLRRERVHASPIWDNLGSCSFLADVYPWELADHLAGPDATWKS